MAQEVAEAQAVQKGSDRTAAGIPVQFHLAPALDGPTTGDLAGLRLHLEHARLKLLREFDQLLCLDGLTGVEHLPHQIETVRKVLRHFRGRVLLADEVGLGKTIEACLLLREYLLRQLVKKVLILVPSPLVSQWREELLSKFGLIFSVPPRTSTANSGEYWETTDQVLCSLSFAKSKKRIDAITACNWDLIIVDEAHHCKNRKTRNWELVNSLRRRHLFLLTATPVQNNLVELYNLLTLLEPGHLKTETDFKRSYVRRGNPHDPRNRERLRSLLGEVMVRNTRSLVQIDLPPRYAHTILVKPDAEEAKLYRLLDAYLRWRKAPLSTGMLEEQSDSAESIPSNVLDFDPEPVHLSMACAAWQSGCPAEDAQEILSGSPELPPLNRMQVNTLLRMSGSHPRALVGSLERVAGDDKRARPVIDLGRRIECSAKEARLLELLRERRQDKTLVFASFRQTLAALEQRLQEAGIPFTVFSGSQSEKAKDEAVQAFHDQVPVMLCSESGGEGRNLQFANTLINFDLPWNPMRIEQRIGRIHRIGQTRDVFIFNLCTVGSLEERILDLLNDKIRMFELVVGEVGSILGNLEGGDEFETLVLNLWLHSQNDVDLDTSFQKLGDSLLNAQEEYLKTKELDEALFGEDYE